MGRKKSFECRNLSDCAMQSDYLSSREFEFGNLTRPIRNGQLARSFKPFYQDKLITWTIYKGIDPKACVTHVSTVLTDSNIVFVFIEWILWPNAVFLKLNLYRFGQDSIDILIGFLIPNPGCQQSVSWVCCFLTINWKFTNNISYSCVD